MLTARPSLDLSVPALVLKVGNYPVHHGGLGVVRSLGRLGVPVYVVCEGRFAPAGLSRYTTGRFEWRTAGQDGYSDQLLSGISAVAEQIGSPAVLVPTDDHAAMFAAAQAETLRRWFLLPTQSTALVRCVADKAWLHEWCLRHEVPVPAGEVIADDAELAAFAATATFPVVAKRGRPWLLRDGRRARSTSVIGSPSELLTQVRPPFPWLLQEQIPVDDGEDWLFHAYCDGESEALVAFTGRKLRSFPPGAGETALGRAEPNPDLEQAARSLLRRLAYAGAVSLDYRFDRRDGAYKLLDVNPRVGAVFRLFETDVGVDVIRALHLDLTGRPVPPGRPIARTVVIEGYDLRSGYSAVRGRRATPAGVWSSWRTVDQTAWWAADDPLPPLVGLARAAAGLVGLKPADFSPCGPGYRAGHAA